MLWNSIYLSFSAIAFNLLVIITLDSAGAAFIYSVITDDLLVLDTLLFELCHVTGIWRNVAEKYCSNNQKYEM